MTVAPEGAGYYTLAGALVTTTVHLVGQYTCTGCDTTQQVITQQLADDYDHTYTRAITNWTALVHAKTCTHPD